LKVLFDEVYNYYDYSGDFCSVLGSEYYEDIKERIIYINSFSKSYSMTGWRLGYAVASVSIIRAMLSVSQNMITCVPPYNQIAGAKAIKERHSNRHVFEDMLFELKKRRSVIQNVLDTRNINYINPNGAFYFFINVGKDSIEASQEFLEQDNIAMVPGLSYGVDFNFYLRFCFAVDDYSYAKLIEWLENVKI
jgi:aspartate/methionine/tyrosine aminotransferase